MKTRDIVLVLVCWLVCCVKGLPLARAGDENKLSRLPMTDNSMYYRLFAEMLTSGSLRRWINQYIIRLSSYDQLSSGKLTTPTPKLTVERDHNSDVFTTTPASGTEEQTAMELKERVTFPIIRLTGSEPQNIMDSTTAGLTVVRDYPQSAPFTLLPARRRKRFVLPVARIDSEAKYDNPGNVPNSASLTDGDEQQGELIMVRDQDNSKDTKSVKTTQPTYQGPAYDTGSSGGLNFKLVKCGHNNQQWCFQFSI